MKLIAIYKSEGVEVRDDHDPVVVQRIAVQPPLFDILPEQEVKLDLETCDLLRIDSWDHEVILAVDKDEEILRKLVTDYNNQKKINRALEEELVHLRGETNGSLSGK